MSSPPHYRRLHKSHGQQGQTGRTAAAVEARARHRGGGDGAAQQEQEEAGTIALLEFLRSLRSSEGFGQAHPHYHITFSDINIVGLYPAQLPW